MFTETAEIDDRRFSRLYNATRARSRETSCFQLVDEWGFKRASLRVLLADIPQLEAAYQKRWTAPYPDGPRITLEDRAPATRLGIACEAAANCLYAMADVAALFSNRVSDGQFPSSFNKLVQRLEKGQDGLQDLGEAIADLQWYRKIREIRTEWTHYSSPFIGGRAAEAPFIMVRSYRRKSDLVEFSEDRVCTVGELISWLASALRCLDNFAEHLAVEHVIPKLDLKAEVVVPIYDAKGWPVIEQDGRFRIRHATIGQLLTETGVLPIGDKLSR